MSDVRSPIADLSYRNYDGVLESPRMRWWVIARTMIQMAVRRKAVTVFAAFSAWYYLAMIFVVLIMQQMAVSMGNDQITKSFVNRIVWKDQFVHGYSFGQLFLLAIALNIGAGTIANDNRANALLVYLSKPVDKLDYVIGKWVGVFVPLFLVSSVPAIVFYMYGALNFRQYGFVIDDPWLLPKVILALGVASFFQSSIIVGISSLFNQGRMAGATYAGGWFFSNFFTQLMLLIWLNVSTVDGGGGIKMLVRNLYYCSFDGLNIGAFKYILGTDGTPYFGLPSARPLVPRPDWWLVALGVLGLSFLSLFVAWRRVRAVEVVR